MTRRAAEHIPCSLTLARIGLTPALLYFMIQGGFIEAVAVFIVICLTDVFDGIAARALGACTHFGAVLDVAADLVYIVSSLIVLNILRLAPGWFTGLVLLKFVEFAVTSYFLSRGRTGPYFVRDLPGRAAAALFFLTPGIVCLFQWLPFNGSGAVVIVFLTVTAAAALASACFRCLLCIKRRRPAGRMASGPLEGCPRPCGEAEHM